MKRSKSKNNKKIRALLSTGLVLSNFISPAFAADWNVSTEAEFRDAAANAVNGDTIIFTNDIVMTAAPPTIVNDVVVNGNEKTIDFNGFNAWNAPNITSVNNLHIVNAGGNNSAFRPLSISGGIHNSSFDNININTGSVLYGGAIRYNHNDTGYSAIIDNTSFTNINVDGTSFLYGGAVYVDSVGRHEITNNEFKNIHTTTSHASGSFGGAMYFRKFQDNSLLDSNLFENNSAANGGAVYIHNYPLNSTFSNNTFKGNDAYNGHGGAMHINGNAASVSFIDNVFENNSSSNNGGGLYIKTNFNKLPLSSENVFDGNKFINNSASQDGGAVFIGGNFISSLNNSSFTGNSATGNGGGMYVGNFFTVNVDSGKTTTFNNNTDSSGTNSIYFGKLGGMGTINLTINGTLNLFDPIKSAGAIPLTKTGTGLLTLGGQNNLGANTWNINDGTLKLTYDSQNNNAQINDALNFNLGANATLEVVPDFSLSNPAQINATNIRLNGKTTVGSDYRFIAQQNFGGDHVLLTLSTAYLGNGDLINTDGQFSLGQYDYEYDNLHWDGNNLVFNVKARSINSERNGAYSANADYRSRLANKTPYLIFEHFRKPFDYLKANQSQQHLAPTEKPSENLWGSAFYSKTNYSAHDGESGASGNISGLILGQDFNVRDDSFNGVAVSVAWPKYEQNTLDANGKDLRLNFYGGKLLKGNWEFGYLATAGFGDMSHDRLAGNVKTSGKKDVKTYALGFNIAKDFYQSQNTTLRPFASYEYIKTHSDGYRESDPLVGITASGHREDVSRIRLGLNYVKHSKNNSSFVGTVFYQGLYGDRNPNISSYMTSTPGSLINLSGSSVDKHALGLGLGWNRRFNEKLNLNLSYNALFSANANDHQIKAELNFNF